MTVSLTIYEKLEYALQHIKDFFSPESNTHIQWDDAYIFVCFIKSASRRIEEVCPRYRRYL